jgi:hypothetical protein
MAGPLYGTEYVAHQITFVRGDVGDVTSVGVYFDTDPNASPEAGEFTEVTLVDGTEEPLPSLAEAGKIDVLALVGPKAGADLDLTTPGDYQTFVLVSTANEDIIRKTGTLTVA